MPLTSLPVRTISRMAALRPDWFSVGVTLRLADSDVTALTAQVALLYALATTHRALQY